MTPRRRQAVLLLSTVALFSFAALAGVEGWVDASVEGRVVMVDDAPPREAALILGAPPGRLLDARVQLGCHLYAGRYVSVLALSGMPREIEVMKEHALRCVPADRILVDDGAERTLSSFVRAKEKLGLTRALVVSQAYHLPRAVFLADAVGFDAIGVIADGEPSTLGWLRERMARLRAQLDVVRLTGRL